MDVDDDFVAGLGKEVRSVGDAVSGGEDRGSAAGGRVVPLTTVSPRFIQRALNPALMVIGVLAGKVVACSDAPAGEKEECH